MQESKRILLVCTGEIPSLHLAREKLAFLKELGLERADSSGAQPHAKNPLFSERPGGGLLGQPVLRVFANDYLAVNHAVESGKLLEPDTELGQELRGLCGAIDGPAGSENRHRQAQVPGFLPASAHRRYPGRLPQPRPPCPPRTSEFTSCGSTLRDCAIVGSHGGSVRVGRDVRLRGVVWTPDPGHRGAAVPDETLLVFCGYLISRGNLNAPGTYIAALAGSCCGITVSYFIGRTAGLAVVHRFGRYLRIEQKQLDRVHGWFDQQRALGAVWRILHRRGAAFDSDHRGCFKTGLPYFRAVRLGRRGHLGGRFPHPWVRDRRTVAHGRRTGSPLSDLRLSFGDRLVVLYFAGRRWMQRRTGAGGGA